MAKEGFTLPKPMVSLHGEMLVNRLIRIFDQNNAEEIRVIVNEQSPALESHLKCIATEAEMQIFRRSTPSSLHSAWHLLAGDPSLDAVCLTTTDTVFNEVEFAAFISAFEQNTEVDAFMAVTAFIDDESPLFITMDSRQVITAFTDQNDQGTPYVSGGIYCLRRNALEVLDNAIQNGVSRMRNFQRQLIENNLNVKGYTFSKIVDVDHLSDIRTAELFLETEQAMNGNFITDTLD